MSEQSERIQEIVKFKIKSLDALKVYKAFCDFRTYVYLCVNKMPKWVKHSEGLICCKSVKNCVMCLSVISRSHSAEEKAEAITSFFAEFDCIYDSLNFFADPQVAALSNHQLAHLARLMNDIESQLQRLRRYLTDEGRNQND